MEKLSWVIRNGEWERYEHPQHGQALTLFIGRNPVFSIYEEFITPQEVKARPNTDTLAALLVKMANLSAQLESAIEGLSGVHEPT